MCSGNHAVGAQTLNITCEVFNTAGPDGDEVLMVFHRPSASIIGRVNGAHPLPLAHLVGFERISVAAGARQSVAFALDVSEALVFINEDGASALYPGLHFVDVINGNGLNITLEFELEAGAARLVRVPPRPY